MERFDNLGGTDTAGAADPFAPVPEDVPAYTWNLGGYQAGHNPEGPNRYVFGGLSDAAFRLLPRLEAGQAERWPWELTA